MAAVQIPDGELVFAAETARQLSQDIRRMLRKEELDTDTYLDARAWAVKAEMMAELFESALERTPNDHTEPLRQRLPARRTNQTEVENGNPDP